MFAGASEHVMLCVSYDCCECVWGGEGGLRHRDPVVSTVKGPTMIDSKSTLKLCLYLGEVGGDCGRRRSTFETAGRDTLSHTLIQLSRDENSQMTHL